MDQAWDIGRNILVDAADLRYQPSTGMGPFECAGCPCKVTVVALESNEVSTHFRTPKGQSHQLGCSVVGPPIPVQGGGESIIAESQRHAGAAFPCTLDRTVEHEVVDDTATDLAERQRSISRERTGKSVGGNDPREVRVSTIRRFARTFADHPSLRATLRIRIPEIDAEYYQFAFKRLASNLITTHAHTRIFYAEIAWKSAPTFTATDAVVTLYAGDRDPQNRARVVRPYTVIIDWSGWSQRPRTALRNEIATAQIDARKATGAEDKSWMFFLASPDPSEPHTFRLDHYSNYAFITATINPPPKPTTTSARARPASSPGNKRSRRTRSN